MVRSWIGVGLVVVVGMLTAGCGKPPEMEMNEATEAMQAAMAGQAEIYAPAENTAAQTAMAQAQAEVEAQNGKFILLRNYDQSKTLYMEATEAARRAGEAATTGKEAVRQEAMSLAAEARSSVEMASKALRSAPRGKGSQADIDAMTTDIQTLNGLLAEVDQSMETERYMDAKIKAQSIKDKAAEIQTAVDAARRKVKVRPKS